MKLPEDPFVRELLPEFVESWLVDLESFSTFEVNNQTDELYRMAHTIKGSCFQFSLDDLGQMGIELMTYAKDNDWVKARTLHNKIKIRFLEVKEFLDTNSLN